MSDYNSLTAMMVSTLLVSRVATPVGSSETPQRMILKVLASLGRLLIHTFQITTPRASKNLQLTVKYQVKASVHNPSHS